MKARTLASALLLGLVPSVASQDVDPPARGLSLELTAAPRLAGTVGSRRAVDFVSRVLAQAGWEVEVDSREVLLSLPRRIELAIYEDGASPRPFLERRERFDPDAIPPRDLPPFNAWTASGEVRGEVVDAGHGMRADFDRLRAARIDLAGKIALCRYGRGYRGVKVRLAEEYGCAGVLLFSPPEDDGAGRGPTWPSGPWKPPYEAQRGAVGPMALGPGDPSTPGFPSPRSDSTEPAEMRRLAGEELAARLPRIVATPIGAAEAEEILQRLSARRMTLEDGSRENVRLGPGPVSVRIAIDAPRDVRTIHNVVATLPGERAGYVIAGNHRDAWVRGAHDAGSGTVGLLRAAQHLGARRRDGWRPAHGVRLAFWDAEESGLIGSTEWGEAHAAELARDCIAYVNCDTLVGGLTFSVSGTPGLEAILVRALAEVAEPVAPGAVAAAPDRTLLDQWMASSQGTPRLGLPGSGSDFTVFLHHLAIPVLDLSFRGNGGGQYHTAFDDFVLMDRMLDPGWVGHETAGMFLAELLGAIAEAGPLSFDDAWAADEMRRHADAAKDWLGTERAARLALAFSTLSRTVSVSRAAWRRATSFIEPNELGPFGTWPAFLAAARSADNAEAIGTLLAAEEPPRFYRALSHADGLEGRGWFKNQLWAPGLETGYGSETFPRLRAAATAGDERALDAALGELLGRIDVLRAAWEARAETWRAKASTGG